MVFLAVTSGAGILAQPRFRLVGSVAAAPEIQWQLAEIAAVVLGLGWLGILAMATWGRLLVALGVLTKKEARGYPYSKPWKDRPLDLS